MTQLFRLILFITLMASFGATSATYFDSKYVVCEAADWQSEDEEEEEEEPECD